MLSASASVGLTASVILAVSLYSANRNVGPDQPGFSFFVGQSKQAPSTHPAREDEQMIEIRKRRSTGRKQKKVSQETLAIDKQCDPSSSLPSALTEHIADGLTKGYHNESVVAPDSNATILGVSFISQQLERFLGAEPNPAHGSGTSNASSTAEQLAVLKHAMTKNGFIVMVIASFSVVFMLTILGSALHCCLRLSAVKEVQNEPHLKSPPWRHNLRQSMSRQPVFSGIGDSSERINVPQFDAVIASVVSEDGIFKDENSWSLVEDVEVEVPRGSQPDAPISFAEPFSFKFMDGSEKSLQWVPSAQGPSLAGPTLKDVEAIALPWTSAALRRALSDGFINFNQWDKQQLQCLTQEIQAGQSFLVRNVAGELRRLVVQVSVVVHEPSSGLVIVEDLDAKMKNRRKSVTADDEFNPFEIASVVPSTDLAFGESVLCASRRCLKERVGIEEGHHYSNGQLGLCDGEVSLSQSTVMSIDADHQSEEMQLRYPGLITLVRKHVVQAIFVGKTNPSQQQALGTGFLHLNAEDGQTWFWKWKNVSEVPSLIKFRVWLSRAMSSDDTNPGFPSSKTNRSKTGIKRCFQRGYSKSFRQVDDKVQPHTPWLRTQILEILEKCRVSAEKFGFVVDALWDEVANGSLSLGYRKSTRELVCFRDIVHLRVVSPKSNAVLIRQTDDGVQWLSTKLLLHETPWCAARRIVREQLGLEDTALNIEYNPKSMRVDICHASRTEKRILEPGKQCCEGVLERQWLATATIPAGMEDLCTELHASEV